MAFRLEDNKLVSDTAETKYQVGQSFQRLLKSLPNESVPQALIMLGILTEELIPVRANSEEHIEIVAENIDKAPTAKVSAQTVKGITWLLSEVRQSLDSERKQTIGKLIEQANLNSPASTDTPTSTSQPKETVDTNRPEQETAPDSESSERNEREGDQKAVKNDSPMDDGESASTNGDIFNCEFCDSPFQSEDKLMSHSIQCDDRPSDARFQCKYCKNKYISERALSQHLEDCSKPTHSDDKNRSDTNNLYKCENCDEEFDSPKKLIKHRHSHSYSEPQSSAHTGSDNKLTERGATGTVEHFNPDDGYGFIYSPDSSEDVFFHVSEYPGQVAEEGERLRFDLTETDRGPKAINISKARPRRIKDWDDTFASKRPRWGKSS